MRLKKHILLTGRPRTGKTTLIKEIVKTLKDPCGGFYTEEMVEEGQRTGFKLRTLDGREGVLASVGLKAGPRLGKYRINLRDLEEIGVKAIEEAVRVKDIIIIDEIGKMELYSEKFQNAVKKALDSGKRVIGVAHISKSKFLNDIRKRWDVIILDVDLNNHAKVLEEVKSIL